MDVEYIKQMVCSTDTCVKNVKSVGQMHRIRTNGSNWQKNVENGRHTNVPVSTLCLPIETGLPIMNYYICNSTETLSVLFEILDTNYDKITATGIFKMHHFKCKKFLTQQL